MDVVLANPQVGEIMIQWNYSPAPWGRGAPKSSVAADPAQEKTIETIHQATSAAWISGASNQTNFLSGYSMLLIKQKRA